MAYRIAVVVWVPKLGDRGNMASGLGFVSGDPLASMLTMVQVFKLGEILVLGDDYRDQMGRKPSKWDVKIEQFASIEEAADRANEVTIAEMCKPKAAR